MWKVAQKATFFYLTKWENYTIIVEQIKNLNI